MKLSYSYLAILASLSLSSNLWGVPSQIAQESFEGTGGSIGYTTSVPQFTELATSPQTDFFSVIPNDGTKIEVNRILANADGTKIFCAEDIDTPRTGPAVAVAAEQSLTTNAVNIAGKINTQVRIKLAAPGRSTDPAQYENFTSTPTAIDRIVVEASIDGGAFQRISQFSPSVSNVASTLTFDANGDNLGDSTANPLTAAFQDFTYSIPTGSTVAVKVTMHSNATGEYLACDDIRIFGESSATNPPSISNVPAGNLIFTEGDSAAAIAPALTLADTDSANLTSASVVISQALVPSEDVLAATPSGALLAGSIVYTPATGTLSITGVASLADYQAVLRSVTYQNSNNVDPSSSVRRVTFVTSDGTNPSNSPIRDINVVDTISVQSVPFVESFETDGRGARYSVDGGFSAPPSMFARTQPGALAGLDGTFAFGVENVDDNPDPTELVTFHLNGSGAPGITGELRVAAGGGAVYDNSPVTPDFLRVEASADGGAFETVLAFYPDAAAQGNMRQDTTPNDSTNFGDGTLLTSALQTFSFNLPTATNLIVRIRAFTNIVGENILFDRLVINGPPPPTITSISSSSANGSYKIGDVIPVVVTFSSPVDVTGTPQLRLETGTTDRLVNYASGTGTNALTFNYTVQAGDTSGDLDYTSTSALTLNGGSISSTLTLATATLTLPSPGTAGSLGANKAIVVDGVVPNVASVSSSTSNGTYKIGDSISIQINFSEAVTVSGTPQLTLETGVTDQVINYASGSGTSTLTFNYTVQTSNSSADLDYLSTAALALNGGTIADAAGNNATLTLAVPGAANSLGNNKALVIDGVRPTAQIVVMDSDLQIGETSLVTFTFSEAVSGFTNADLIIENGSLSAVSSSDGGFTWTATLTPTANINDATNVISLNNAGLADIAGNTGSGVTQSNNYAVSSLAISIAANTPSAAEGSGNGTTAFTFTVSRTGGTTGAITMDYAVTGAADATDFGGTLPSGQFTIPNGQASAVLTINVSQDTTVESNETFTVTLSNASGGYVLSTPAASSTITNDDFEADLAVTVTDGTATAVSGTTVTYTITASNAGPHPATSATLTDNFPASLSDITWTSVGAGGGAGTASGTGNINDTVNLPANGSVTYTVSGTISPAATGTLSNTASVTSSVTDPVPGNNSATDSDTLTSQADLSITKTDGVTTATPGGSVTYTITASNAGPSNVTGATLADTLPASLTDTWAAIGAGGGTVTASGSGNINELVNLPVGGSVTFTVSATISPSATGTLSNTATITAPAGVTDPTPGNNSKTDADTLVPQANLAITKTDGVTTAIPGNTVTYTITASNAGPSNAPGATVADTFPASLTGTWTAVGAGGGTATASGSGDINDTVNLPTGGSVTYTVTTTVSALATGTLSNTATVTPPAGVTDSTPGNNSATDSDTLTPQANLSITKTDGVTAATPGGSVTYTITASNAGPSSVTGATVADTLSAELSGATWTASGTGGGTATASGSGSINDTVNLPVGSSVTYTVSAPISSSATGTLGNTATITAPAGVTDSTPGDNSATDTDTLVSNADLSITKTDGVTTATPGGSVTYIITASNAGPSNVTAATLADTLPGIISGATWTGAGAGGGTGPASGSGDINASNISLPAGGSFTFTVTAPISAAATGTLSNTATITSAITDPTPGNNSATDTDTLTPKADLSITKTDGVVSAVPGNSVTYTVTASNAGPSNVPGATVADTLPGIVSGATWTATGAGGGTATASGSGNISDTVNLPVGASVTYTVTAPISAAATGTLSNTATVTAPGGVTDPTPGNNSATDSDTLTPQADLAVTLTDSPDPVSALGNLTYTITLSNNGLSNAVSPTVSLPLPAKTTFVSATAPGAWTTSPLTVGTNGTITFDDASLASGASATFTVVAKVDIDVVNDSVLTGTVTASSTTTDSVSGNNSATTTTLAKSGADLQITLTDAPDPVVAGTELTYSIQVQNNGPLDADNVSISDSLPVGTTFVSVTLPSGWSATTPAVGANGLVTITRPLFANAASATITLVAKVNSNVASATNLNDTAGVTSTTIDIAPDNNSATATTAVTIQSDLVVDLSVTPTTAPKGSNVTYTITLTNNGPSDAAAPYLSLPLPSQMTFVSVTKPSGWSSSAPTVGAGGTVNFSATSLAKGATATFKVVAKVKTNAVNGAVMTATAVASSTGVDPVLGNNSDTATAAVGTTSITAVQPVITGIGVTSQTGLFDVMVNVTNSTPVPINGFRLHVDYGAYKAAYPSLRLYNASSGQNASDVYIDYPFPISVDAVVAVKLSFYTSTRTFPSPFKPKLTVEILQTSQVAGTNGSGIQPRLVMLTNKTVMLEFPSKVGRWYRMRFSSDIIHWQDSPVPLQAGSTRMQWIDSGPPFTDKPPAQAPSRFYRVNEIAAP